MAANPPITVVMPAHNTEPYIAQAIQSILNQTFTDFELWVLENGSTDRTAEIARSFTDPRVKVFELGPVGFQGALQYALDHAPAEWLARMDSDDLSFPHRFERQMQVIEECPDVVMVGTCFAILTPFGHIFERRLDVASREVDVKSVALASHGRYQRARFFTDASVIFKRSAALQVGGYDPEFTMGDVPLWLRMLEHGRGWEIAETLYVYRLRPHSVSKQHIESPWVRKKYTPQYLSQYAPDFDFNNPPTKPRSRNSFWDRICRLEALSGDVDVVRQAANRLERDGYELQAKRFKRYSYLGKAGLAYYRWRYNRGYRHRPDWEELFAPLIQAKK